MTIIWLLEAQCTYHECVKPVGTIMLKCPGFVAAYDAEPSRLCCARRQSDLQHSSLSSRRRADSYLPDQLTPSLPALATLLYLGLSTGIALADQRFFSWFPAVQRLYDAMMHRDTGLGICEPSPSCNVANEQNVVLPQKRKSHVHRTHTR